MRSPRLDPLFASLASLKGVGPRLEAVLAKLLKTEGPPRVVDLLLHAPTGVVDRRAILPVAAAEPGALVTLKVRIDRHRPSPPGKSRAPYRVLASDDTGDLTLVFFNAPRARLEPLLPVGEERLVSGRLELFDGMRQMPHPERILDPARLEETPLVEAVHPLTEGLSGGALRRILQAALARTPALGEWIDPHLVAERGWPDVGQALRRLHAPAEPADCAPDGVALTRLAYDEILASQIALALVRRTLRRPRGRAHHGDGSRRRAIEAALPFVMTGAQRRAIDEILADMAADKRMIRLLQGDVGSGKTLVALMAAAAAAEAGRQTAFMAPTEILARQHAATLARLGEPAGLAVRVLTGRETGRERAEILAGLAGGAIDLVVGTHALFQDDVAFRDLGLAVIDEQHRFGVHQRLALTAKGASVDMLVMTATPIPRTLVLAYFGDMDVSRLDEKPPGRTPVDTRLIAAERLDEVVDGLGRALAAGRQAYWVCPLVEESEESDLTAATERWATLSARFGAGVGLVHGRMKGAEKDAAMADFSAGRTRLLVATTVIEVGVDVPAASIMVIENAQAFGLAQLHQLRGRIGRGAERSTCLLVYAAPLGETATRRLELMRETEDGFRLAEEDLRLRGEGDLLGSRQSGQPGFRLARLETHGALLELARTDARALLERDPELSTPRGLAVRDLLHLFGRDDAVRLIRAG